VTHFVDIGSDVLVRANHGWIPDDRLSSLVFASRSGCRRLCPDLPGVGRRPVGEGLRPATCFGRRPACGDLLAALEEFVDAETGGEPYLLVGESYGGYLSRPPAHRRPVQVSGRVLISTTGRHLRPAVRSAEMVRRFVADILLGLRAAGCGPWAAGRGP
jgi:pimeloyl-ACP methyl ester carboxylesterase